MDQTSSWTSHLSYTTPALIGVEFTHISERASFVTVTNKPMNPHSLDDLGLLTIGDHGCGGNIQHQAMSDDPLHGHDLICDLFVRHRLPKQLQE
jgi:hypothetical protein